MLISICASVLLFRPFGRKRRFGCEVGLIGFLIALGALWHVSPQPALCQDLALASNRSASSEEALLSAAISSTSEQKLAVLPAGSSRQTVESEVIVEGLASYGHYRMFASGSGAHLYTAGVEYDRNSWGRFLGAQMDYTAEILPLVLLNTATQSDIWGSPTTTAREIVPGVGIYPIGFRLMWRDKRVLKPYMIAKGGMLGFTQKAMSQKATYENFALQYGMGLQVRMNERLDLRLGLFSDFHFSNAFIVPVNPGLDVMSSTLGVSYHLGRTRGR